MKSPQLTYSVVKNWKHFLQDEEQGKEAPPPHFYSTQGYKPRPEHPARAIGCVLPSHPQCDGIWRRGLWEVIRSWEGRAFTNGISALRKKNPPPKKEKDPRELPCPFCHVRAQEEDSHLWTKKETLLTRHHNCWCLYLGFLRLQNCEK